MLAKSISLLTNRQFFAIVVSYAFKNKHMTHEFKKTVITRNDEEPFTHTVDTRYAARMSDEVVERTNESGEKVFGEVIATFGTGLIENFKSDKELLDSHTTLCVVRYSDGSVGIASRMRDEGDKPTTMHPGRILQPDTSIYFGRNGDKNSDEPILMNRIQVLGRKALTGLDTEFEKSVSRIQGSIHLWSDGKLEIHDGYDYAHPETRVVIDRPSSFKTRVHTSSEKNRYEQSDIITPYIEKHEQEKRMQRFKEIFGAPKVKAKDRFGNNQDRVSLMSEQSRRDAIQTLTALRDPVLKGIIGMEDQNPEDVVDTIFSDDTMRANIARYLMQKVTQNADMMPDRVRLNRGKMGNHPGYPSGMSSREYASVLALSMLDGTFVSERSIKDPVEFITKGNSTEINGGQHRLAALRLLDLDYEKAPTVIEQVRKYY